MVTPETLGAWVIKCNPRRTPVDAMRAAGRARPQWCVAGNYRSRLMRADQRVLLWVTTHRYRGIWGCGRLLGEPVEEDGRLHVPVDIPLLRRPVTAAELARLPGLRSMEVFRAPQQANPSWVSRTEWSLIDAVLSSQ